MQYGMWHLWILEKKIPVRIPGHVQVAVRHLTIV